MLELELFYQLKGFTAEESRSMAEKVAKEPKQFLRALVQEELGLSEETDAAVIVVSEQTGAISVAHRGVFYSRLDEGQLRSELSRIFRIRAQDEPVVAPSDPEPRAAN